MPFVCIFVKWPPLIAVILLSCSIRFFLNTQSFMCEFSRVRCLTWCHSCGLAWLAHWCISNDPSGMSTLLNIWCMTVSQALPATFPYLYPLQESPPPSGSGTALEMNHRLKSCLVSHYTTVVSCAISVLYRACPLASQLGASLNECCCGSFILSPPVFILASCVVALAWCYCST